MMYSMTEPGDPRQSPNLETHKKDRLPNLDIQEDGDLFYVWRMRVKRCSNRRTITLENI